MQKLKAIVVDDHLVWVDIICATIQEHFGEKLEIEKFSDFSKARLRIMHPSTDFDLLITDIFNEVNDLEGLIFTRFADEMKNRSVIVVTAGEDIIRTTYKYYNVIGVFSKENWVKDKMKFILAVNTAIMEALKRMGNEHPNKDTNNSTYLS